VTDKEISSYTESWLNEDNVAVGGSNNVSGSQGKIWSRLLTPLDF
jgi:hypothetical protein